MNKTVFYYTNPDLTGFLVGGPVDTPARVELERDPKYWHNCTVQYEWQMKVNPFIYRLYKFTSSHGLWAIASVLRNYMVRRYDLRGEN